MNRPYPTVSDAERLLMKKAMEAVSTLGTGEDEDWAFLIGPDDAEPFDIKDEAERARRIAAGAVYGVALTVMPDDTGHIPTKSVAKLEFDPNTVVHDYLDKAWRMVGHRVFVTTIDINGVPTTGHDFSHLYNLSWKMSK